MRRIKLLLPAVASLLLSCREAGPLGDAPPRSSAARRDAGTAGARGEPTPKDLGCLNESDLDFIVPPTDPERISDTRTYMMWVRVHDDKLYYNGKQALYSMPLSGGRAIEIYSDRAKPPIQNFFIREKDYLVVHGHWESKRPEKIISRVPMDGTPPNEVPGLIDNTDVWRLIYQDDILYGSYNPRELYSLNLNTGERIDLGSIAGTERVDLLKFFVDDGIMLISEFGDPAKLLSIRLSDRSMSDYTLSPMPTKLSALGATGGYFYYSASTDPGPGSQIRRAPLASGASEVVADVSETVWGQLAVSEAGLAIVSSIPTLRILWQPKGADSPTELACMGGKIVGVEDVALHGNVLYAVVGLTDGPTITPDSWGIIRRPLE